MRDTRRATCNKNDKESECRTFSQVLHCDRKLSFVVGQVSVTAPLNFNYEHLLLSIEARTLILNYQRRLRCSDPLLLPGALRISQNQRIAYFSYDFYCLKTSLSQKTTTWPSGIARRSHILRDGSGSRLEPIAFDIYLGWLRTRRAQAHFAVFL